MENTNQTTCNHCNEELTEKEYEKYHGMCEDHFMNGTFEKVAETEDGRPVTKSR